VSPEWRSVPVLQQVQPVPELQWPLAEPQPSGPVRVPVPELVLKSVLPSAPEQQRLQPERPPKREVLPG
jgi:hypothetical protein